MRRRIEQTEKVLVIIAVAYIAVFVFTSGSAGTTVAPPDVAATYKSKCASGQGDNGNGQTATGKTLKRRDLRSAEVQGLSDEQLYEIIAKGKGKMPGYEKTLGGDTSKALAAYVRQLAGK